MKDLKDFSDKNYIEALLDRYAQGEEGNAYPAYVPVSDRRWLMNLDNLTPKPTALVQLFDIRDMWRVEYTGGTSTGVSFTLPAGDWQTAFTNTAYKPTNAATYQGPLYLLDYAQGNAPSFDYVFNGGTINYNSTNITPDQIRLCYEGKFFVLWTQRIWDYSDPTFASFTDSVNIYRVHPKKYIARYINTMAYARGASSSINVTFFPNYPLMLDDSFFPDSNGLKMVNVGTETVWNSTCIPGIADLSEVGELLNEKHKTIPSFISAGWEYVNKKASTPACMTATQAATRLGITLNDSAP